MYHMRAVLLLAVVYLALTANLQFSNIVMGLLLGAGIVWLLGSEGRPVGARFLPRSVIVALRYVLLLVYDLILSGIQVARIVLDPALPIRPGNVAIPMTCSSEMTQALSAHAITLTPGEMVVEMDEEGVMYTHVLDATHAVETVADAQRVREELLGRLVA